MKISLSWLKEFVDVPSDAAKLKLALVGVGLGVESYTTVGDDVVLEVEVTTNRPDCLSHYGVARELAALYRRPLRPLAEVLKGVKESGVPAMSEATIAIADPDLCARYCGRVIRGVKVQSSPAWLVKRLEAVGQRPINNVADITNYVLMELGHPLHAFDLARLRQKKIIVRRARSGELMRTLDGVDRRLTTDSLVIADAERPVALAGVMGGEDSEISFATRDVLLESAWFEPVSIRRTSKSQGLHTEASHRFERGADVEMAPRAADRAAELIRELAGGEILSGVIDVYPRRLPRSEVVFRASEIRRILGTDIAKDEVEQILQSLGFAVEAHDDSEWRVVPPSYRLDVSREIDLVEEIARVCGYDGLPSRLRSAPPHVERDTRRERELAISSVLVGLGYREIITSSMVDPAENARFTDRPPVVLTNPLSQEASVMRSTAVPSMVLALRWNLDRGQENLRLFEVGKTYTAMPNGALQLPDERRVLTLGACGHRRPASVHDSAKPLDFFDLKGDVESLLALFEISELRFRAGDCSYLEPGLAGNFTAGGKTFTTFGELQLGIAHDYKLRQPAWLAEVDLDTLLALPLGSRTFRAISKFPAVERDFSLVLPDGVTYARLEESFRRLAVAEIQSLRPADLFRGGSVKAGHYSLLLRVTFQSEDRTLTSAEAVELGKRLLTALEPLGVRLRKAVDS